MLILIGLVQRKHRRARAALVLVLTVLGCAARLATPPSPPTTVGEPFGAGFVASVGDAAGPFYPVGSARSPLAYRIQQASMGALADPAAPPMAFLGVPGDGFVAESLADVPSR